MTRRGALPLAGALTAGSMLAGTPVVAMGAETRAFIVSCQCRSAADRVRIAAAVRRVGGRILYQYQEIGGMAVSAPGFGDPRRFAARIARIRGVVAVRPERMLQVTKMVQ